MHFRIYNILFVAFLIGHAAATQSNGFSFNNDDADIEGSGIGEVTQDLGESSGSGSGPPEDDEDGTETRTETPSLVPHIPDTFPEVYKPQPAPKPEVPERRPDDPTVVMNPTKHEERQTSFFAQPGILAAVIGGAVVGLLCAILVVMFIVYRMRKKDEGSYALGEPKQSPNQNSYSRSGNNKEFYA